MPETTKQLVELEDPLSDDAFEFLLNYTEEDVYVDYKVTFHADEEREWLEITKDIMAFANAFGGYLFFGIHSGTYEKIGLEPNVVEAITDINNIHQKINRYVEPPIGSLRSRSYFSSNKGFAAIFIPASIGITHMISKDGSFRFPSREEKVVLRKGTLYVRKVGANHLVESRDLDGIIDRRMNQFRTSLLDKIARVVEAPQESEVFVITEDPTAAPHSKFVIENAPDSIPVKGMSFTVSPKTTEQEIAAWTAMSRRDPSAIPTSKTTWRWYEKRKSIEITNQLKTEVAMFCLLSEVPAFYWLQGCPAKMIKDMLLETASRRSSPNHVIKILGVSAFLGKQFYEVVVDELGDYVERRLGQKYQRYPDAGPSSLFGRVPDIKAPRTEISDEQLENLENELNQIAASVGEKNKDQPGHKERWRAHALDCYLYAREYKYGGATKNASSEITESPDTDVLLSE